MIPSGGWRAGHHAKSSWDVRLEANVDQLVNSPENSVASEAGEEKWVEDEVELE